jgi:hypothetical protein
MELLVYYREAFPSLEMELLINAHIFHLCKTFFSFCLFSFSLHLLHFLQTLAIADTNLFIADVFLSLKFEMREVIGQVIIEPVLGTNSCMWNQYL